MSMVSPRQHESEEKDAMVAEEADSSSPQQESTQEPPVLVRVPLNLTRQMSDLSF